MDIPSAAWKRRLNRWPTEQAGPLRPSFEALLGMLPKLLRLRRFINREKAAGRIPYMDLLDPLNPGPVMGVPLGGLGGGSITRGWQGDFPRMQMRPGQYSYDSLPTNFFSAFVRRQDAARGKAQVMFPGEPEGTPYPGWGWDMEDKNATYYALYPRAWTAYRGLDPEVNMICRQISPVIPHNYKESSYPVSVFVWEIENTGSTSITAGLMLTWLAGLSLDDEPTAGSSITPFNLEGAKGMALRTEVKHHQGAADPLTFAVAVQTDEGIEVTRRSFAARGSAMDIWADFAADGRLEDDEAGQRSARPGEANLAAGTAATLEIPPGERREVAFALSWDMPLARFGQGRAHYRRYTRFYGRAGDAAPRIAADALAQYPEWEAQIEAWQQPILDDEDLPNWYKAALFNQLYYVADGGTLWTDGEEGSPPNPEDDLGHFMYLEGHEYLMYNTYDVHFYASFALAMLWPQIELSIQRDFAKALETDLPEERMMLFAGRKAPRAVPGMIAHDLGGPTEDPLHLINIYNLEDTNRWKDLNPKFVLQIMRDYTATSDGDFLRQMWPAVQQAISAAQAFDIDDDGMIDNDGTPDQTYDTWPVSGPSAYSGGLWIACLAAAAAMANVLGESEAAASYQQMLTRAQAVYEEELWNGQYYDYDSSGIRTANTIMADQLAGQWYARAAGLGGIVPPENARSALLTVFNSNVMQFEEGMMGAVNGMRPDGRVDTISQQSQEVWTGVTYAVAAAMLQEGLVAEAFQTASGIPATLDRLGLWFAAPEAWFYDGSYRSLSYMRPLAIWAMQWAWERLSPEERSRLRQPDQQDTQANQDAEGGHQPAEGGAEPAEVQPSTDEQGT